MHRERIVRNGMKNSFIWYSAIQSALKFWATNHVETWCLNKVTGQKNKQTKKKERRGKEKKEVRIFDIARSLIAKILISVLIVERDHVSDHPSPYPYTP